MPKIIPIPANIDNYIGLVRKGAQAAVVDPGDTAPVLACRNRATNSSLRAGLPAAFAAPDG